MTLEASQRRLEYMALPAILAADKNPKAHDDQLIGESIGRFGLVETPVLDERTGKLVAGHGRTDELRRRQAAGEDPPDGVEARDGVWFVPVLRGWSSSSDDEAHAAGIALNRVGEAGGWKMDVLVPMLDTFAAGDLGLAGLGFDADALQRATADLERTKITPAAPTAPEEREAAARIRVPDKGDEKTARGDVWLLGDHRIMCGDCRDTNDVDRLLETDRVNVAFTSPPYAEQREYDMESGFRPIKPDEYVDWFADVSARVAEHLADDGSWFVNIKPASDGLDTELYVYDLVVAHVRLWGWHFATEFSWERNGVPKQVKRRFKNQFEPVFQFARGEWKLRPENVRFPSENVPVPAGPGIGSTSWDVQQGEEGSVRFGEQNRKSAYDYDAGVPEEDRGHGGDLSRRQGNGAPLIVPRKTDSAYDYSEGNYPALQGSGRSAILPRTDHSFVRLTPGEGTTSPAGRPRTHPGTSTMSDLQGENYGVGAYIGPGLAYPGNRLPTFAGTHDAVGHAAAFPVGLPAWFVRAFTDRGDVVFDPFLGSGSTVLAAEDEGRRGRGMELSGRYVDVACARWQARAQRLPILAATGEPWDFLPGRS